MAYLQVRDEMNEVNHERRNTRRPETLGSSSTASSRVRGRGLKVRGSNGESSTVLGNGYSRTVRLGPMSLFWLEGKSVAF